MKHHVTQHSRRTFETSPHSEAPGPQASAFAPPAYGIDFADRGMPAPAPVQCFGQLEEERGIQEPFATSVAAPVTARPAPAPNRTGLPDRLKVGIESLSGLDLSDVRVHSNSDKPAQFNALAYAQGSDIHVAPGQEHHLAHEAWHVVQQAHGRVKPTRKMKDGEPVNEDPRLEREAEAVGAQALQKNHARERVLRKEANPTEVREHQNTSRGDVMQFNVAMKGKGEAKRTDGTLKSLEDEVAATIGRHDYQEILEDIARLSQSISSRTGESGRFKPHTDAWETHKHRTNQEKGLLRKLESAKEAIEEERKPKPKPSGKGRGTGKTASTNIYALLSESQ